MSDGVDEHPWPTILAEAVAILERVHGLEVSSYNESFLTNSLGRRMSSTACASAVAYLQRLTADGAEAQALYRSLRVSYSDFFRNPLAFALLEQQVLPALVEQKSRSGEEIRIWSAGCAAGQEAWSMAILLDELVAAGERSVPFRIFATDISERDLAVARAGVYNGAALGNVRLRHLADCFSRQGEAYRLAPRLQERVDFSHHDLLKGGTTAPPASIFGDFDLVFCSNVLIYYRAEALRLIFDKLRRCLLPGGYLVTGETERQFVGNAGGFHAVAPPATVFRRVV